MFVLVLVCPKMKLMVKNNILIWWRSIYDGAQLPPVRRSGGGEWILSVVFSAHLARAKFRESLARAAARENLYWNIFPPPALCFMVINGASPYENVIPTFCFGLNGFSFSSSRPVERKKIHSSRGKGVGIPHFLSHTLRYNAYRILWLWQHHG